MPATQIRVLILDEPEMIGALLVETLQPETDITVIGPAATSLAAMALAAKDAPDVILIRLADAFADGESVIRDLLQAAPAARILSLAPYQDEPLARHMRTVGAHRHYDLDEPFSLEDLAETVRKLSKSSL